MEYWTLSGSEVLKELNSDGQNGLTTKKYAENLAKFGKNAISEKKNRSLFKKIWDALTEPMLIILLFSFFIALGVTVGKFLKTGEGDFGECFGILFAVILSVSITLIMEGSSEKAFKALGRIYDSIAVKVIRDGEVIVTKKELITVGDVIVLSSGDKIIADGRVIESNDLSVDESALTGESVACHKSAEKVVPLSVPLAERVNCVYSGSYIVGGEGKMVVTAVGDKTEIGYIAKELKNKKEGPLPLQQKLAKLGKYITAIGISFAVCLFVLSVIKLYFGGLLTFDKMQDLFISCIVLIVAAVPEGLPTIVAVSLALNMIKLAKENALIKKMIATETAGAVSVICSDKTGTLTENKMVVTAICGGELCTSPENLTKEALIQNFVINNTSDIIKKKDEIIYRGSGTECALLAACIKKDKNFDYKAYRKKYEKIFVIPFSSDRKMMTTVIKTGDINRELVKGAPEKILPLINFGKNQLTKINEGIEKKQKAAGRVLCFAHNDGNGYLFDGYCVLKDGIRPHVKGAVNSCKSAGIKVKILTGDNYLTAFAVARELGIAKNESEVISAQETEKYSDEEFKKILPKISVIARSTPAVKLRVVKLLKECGEVVAVTGDGINDAPAIKQADVGIAMGKSGSEITKEAADIILLDDSFNTIVKAVSFGRNVFKNLQRFIVFQLSVNVSALLFITFAAVIGYEPPFNTLQLLWINVIMDGPPALTLGLESMGDSLMKNKPEKRDKSIVSVKMLIKILFNGIFVATIMSLQYTFNFLGASEAEKSGAIFTLFVFFQLFNAFNSRELGANSIFKSVGKNKIMVVTFAALILIQIFIVEVAYPLFHVSPISFVLWLKIAALSSTVILVTELSKLFYRIILGVRLNKLRESKEKTEKNANSLKNTVFQ